MFGTMTVCSAGLTEEQLARYRAVYCGLCRTLGERSGQASRLTLNYDMTFLCLLLTSLYEPEEACSEGKCIAHPGQQRGYVKSEIINYCADMNIALSYLNLLDNWQDDSSVLSAAAAAALKREYKKIRLRYPGQCENMEKRIKELSELEKSGAADADSASACFGSLLAPIFAVYDDYWHDALYALGYSLGRFIYLMDACLDLERDTAKNSYNPFRRYYGLDNAELFSDILKMHLADAVSAFDYLPLVKDADIMKNILCMGVWTGFDKKYFGNKNNNQE